MLPVGARHCLARRRSTPLGPPVSTGGWFRRTATPAWAIHRIFSNVVSARHHPQGRGIVSLAEGLPPSVPPCQRGDGFEVLRRRHGRYTEFSPMLCPHDITRRGEALSRSPKVYPPRSPRVNGGMVSRYCDAGMGDTLNFLQCCVRTTSPAGARHCLARRVTVFWVRASRWLAPTMISAVKGFSHHILAFPLW